MDRGIRRSFKGSFNHVEVELFAQYLVLSLEQRCEKNLSEGSVRFPKTECQVFERHRYFVQPGSPGPLHDVIERVGGKERVASPIQRKREKERNSSIDRIDPLGANVPRGIRNAGRSRGLDSTEPLFVAIGD